MTRPLPHRPGRRHHALGAEKGRAHRLLVSLSDDDRASLDELAALMGASRAEVVRRLVRSAVVAAATASAATAG